MLMLTIYRKWNSCILQKETLQKKNKKGLEGKKKCGWNLSYYEYNLGKKEILVAQVAN